MEAINVTDTDITNILNAKNELQMKVGHHAATKQEIDSMISLINEKDEIIKRMDEEMERLIK
jgi:hypothetical protein